MQQVSYYALPGLKGERTLVIRSHPEKIIDSVCEYHGLTPSEIKTPSRKRDLMEARMASMYLLRSTGLSFKKIGNLFNRDHTTVIHNVNLAKDFLSIDSPQGDMIRQLRYDLGLAPK